jgi:hypothetical protein
MERGSCFLANITQTTAVWLVTSLHEDPRLERLLNLLLKHHQHHFSVYYTIELKDDILELLRAI